MTPERSQMAPYTSNKASSLTGSGLAKLLIILLAITAAINVVVIARTNLGPTVVEGEGGTIFIQPDSSFYARRVRVEIALIIAVIGFWLYRARRKAAVAAIALVSLGWVVVEYLLWLGRYFVRSDTSEAQTFYSVPHIFYLQKANWLDVWIIALVIVCIIWEARRLIRGSNS